MDTALDPQLAGKAKRAGALHASGCDPYDPSPRPAALRRRHGAGGRATADRRGDRLLAFEGARAAVWLTDQDAAALLDASPDGNVTHEHAVGFVRTAVDGLGALEQHLAEIAAQRGEALLDAHRRVRRGSEGGRRSYTVEPQLPVDVLGVYVLLPVVDT